MVNILEQAGRKPLVIAGSGRSGTTWVLDVIASANNLKTVFEPLLPATGDTQTRFASHYVPEDAEVAELQAFVGKMLAGSLDNVWTNYRIRPDRLRPTLRTLSSRSRSGAMYRRYKQLLGNLRVYNKGPKQGVAIKLIRANLMLDWMAKCFDIDILFVLRHPCAVIESKMRLDQAARDTGLIDNEGDWDPYIQLEQYMGDERFKQDFISPYLDGVHSLELTQVEANAVIWCLENGPVLRKGQGPKRCLACYETMVERGDEEWRRIGDELDISGIVDQSLLAVPSQQASQDFRGADSVTAKLCRWQDRLDPQDKERIEYVLQLFGIDIYSAFEPMPKAVFGFSSDAAKQSGLDSRETQ